MDLEKFLELADAFRRAQSAHVSNRPIGQVYEELKHGTSPLKFTVMNDEVFVAVDGLSRALLSY